jgi:hypothetical protein
MTISPVFQDLLIGIVTSVITGVAVWLWQKLQQSRLSNRKAQFFGLKPKDECLVVVGHYRGQNATSHGDIDSMIEAVKAIHNIGFEVKVASFEKAIESPGDSSEICIAGPDSNERTGTHLKTFFNDIHVNPYNNETDRLAIVTKKKIYRFENGEKEYALLAKFFPKVGGKPVFLICGQTAFSNKGASYYLAKNYDGSIRKKYGNGEFCFIVRVISPWKFGHKSVELVDDISKYAFIQSNKSQSQKGG